MITSYEVVRVDPDGSGYVVVYADNGQSFGQNFTHAPVSAVADFEAYLKGVVMEAHDRLFPAPVPTAASAVLDLKGKRQTTAWQTPNELEQAKHAPKSITG